MARLADIVTCVAKKTGLSRSDAARAVRAVFDVVTEELQKNGEVSIYGFGKFKVTSIKGRTVNLGGKKMKVGPVKVVRFKPFGVLKKKVNEK